jgi:hypothetical protein
MASTVPAQLFLLLWATLVVRPEEPATAMKQVSKLLRAAPKSATSCLLVLFYLVLMLLLSDLSSLGGRLGQAHCGGCCCCKASHAGGNKCR